MATARLAGPSGGADVISGYEVDVGRVDVFHRNEAGSDREELRPLGLDIAPGSLRVSRRTCCAAGEHPGSCGGASGAALWLATGAGLSEAAPLDRCSLAPGIVSGGHGHWMILGAGLEAEHHLAGHDEVEGFADGIVDDASDSPQHSRSSGCEPADPAGLSFADQ